MLSSLLKINSLVVIILFSLAWTSVQAKSVDFQTIYQSAQINNIDLKFANSVQQEAEADVGIARAAFMPKLGVEVRQEQFTSEIEDNSKNTSNIYAEWNLFNGFKDVQKRKSLEAEFSLAKTKADRISQNFEWIAKEKYAKAYSLQEQVESYKKIIDSNLKNLDVVKRQRLSGRLSEADFLEFQLFDAKLRQDLVRLELDAAVSLAELKLFAGLSDFDRLVTKLEPSPLMIDSAQIKKLTTAEKSKLVESQLKVESLTALRANANGSFLPTVDFRATRGSVGYRDTVKDPETILAITARWEFFSGLESVNQKEKAIAQLTKAQIQYNNDKLKIASRSDQLLSQINNIVLRMKFEEGNQKNVEKFLKTVESDYRRGVKSSSDLKAALDLILQTSLNLSMLRSDYFSLRAELQDLVGQTLDEQKM